MAKSAQHELTRKEMKGPDKFQVAATQAAGWATGHRRQIVVALAAAAAAVAIALGILAWRESSRETAGGLLYRTAQAASGEVSSIPLPGVPGPLYKTDAERQQAVADAARKVRQEHGSTRAGETAALAEGDARFHLGEWDAALAAYKAFLDGAPGDDSLRFAALEGIARVHEAKGDLAAAATAWEKVGEVKFYADRAALERARVLERAGKADEARKALAAFPEQFKDSPLRTAAERQLARLGK
jgi:predicted negative regulator of RcsB-dependent stress response